MKSIYDYKHVAGTKAIALLRDGKMVGKIIANFSDNPAGSVCTASVILYGRESGIGRAGGYGYDKFSSAVAGALRSMGLLAARPHGDNTPDGEKIAVYAGAGNVREAFEAAGYTYLEVV